jgi:histidyl-tRNA synthetase
MQCDFDTIGTDSYLADIETLLVIHDLIERIGFARFTIRVNHRGLLNGLLEMLDLADKSAAVLRALDKLPKIGREGVLRELLDQVGADMARADRLLLYAEISGNPSDVLSRVEALLEGNVRGLEGVAKLRQLFDCVTAAGVSADRVALDVSIARGLDYYTGTVYETFLDELPDIGSICSGGRYDNLAGLFTNQPLPGVGASLGLDRLLAAMDELGPRDAPATPACVLVVLFDQARAGEYFRLARQLRKDGIATEVYPQERPLKKQLQYADRKGFRFAVIAGSQEFEQGIWQLKDLARGEQLEVETARLSEIIRERLDRD